MDSIMESTNIYKQVKVHKSEQHVKRGFCKTIIHVIVLLLAIIVMTVYQSQIEFTRNESEIVDTTKNDYIPYSRYEEIYNEYFNAATILTCDCKRNQISWGAITKEIYISQDDICITSYIAADPCYRDPVCQNSPVYSVLYWQLSELCETAQLLYPSTPDQPRGSVTTSTLITNDDLFGRAREEALKMMGEITGAFKTSYEMNYRLINEDTAMFYEWANGVTLEELSNESYWLNDWNMTYNASLWMAIAWSEWTSDVNYYVTISDAIGYAFLSDIEIVYRYSMNGTDGLEGYYEKCQPYQCNWLLPGKKTPLEIATTVFALIGGIHASLFLIINIGHKLFRKCRGEKDDEDEDGVGSDVEKGQKDKNEGNAVQMSRHQEAAAMNTAGIAVNGFRE